MPEGDDFKFNVETSVGKEKILGFQMFHAKLEDEVNIAVTAVT
jgi:hypothetical protein